MSAAWQPRLVAFDIDGTIVDHDSVMPEELRRAIGAIAADGTPVVLSTGRSWHDTQAIVDHLGLPEGPFVCSNGAVIVRYPPTQVVRMVTFDPSDVIERVARIAPQALIAVEEVGTGYRLSGPFPPGDLTGTMDVVGLDDLASRPVTRVIVRDPGSSPEEFIELAERLGLHGVSYFIGWSAWLDIAPEGIHKAMALADVCARRGIDAADVLALGDGRNDIEMLGWAGRGVAMGDAPEEVQQVADHVTGRFDDGGTLAELRRWFDLP
ncbi:HAD-superfamily hydrolase, subfamily IIB [Raineyella antarctica]|uniref:HAD-superfamily hydrolase, subfamily IIB n=1 Tax=Raineyella antarctica TaxID=1577474 RepID=A0A1G6GFZ2_9ACTN|nr:HAD family hydrolase [Raineyella antarctica]SDB80907.1 HAD-superfamily hydrolase, subfamily IIB [Raineyella antarctica]